MFIGKHIAGQFRTKNLEYEIELDMIFGGTVSTGEGMMSQNAYQTLFDSIIDDMTYDCVIEDVGPILKIPSGSFEFSTT